MPVRGSKTRDVLWRSLDGIGLEHCRFTTIDTLPLLFGTVLTADDKEPVTIDYAVKCDRLWRTQEVLVQLLRVSQSRTSVVQMHADGSGEWTRVTESDGHVATRNLPKINGCIDIDLAFSPMTNTLPIRRLNLVIGASADVTAAWLQFPSLEIKPLPQRYTRLSERTYRYESFLTNFTATLEVDDLGLVRTYEGVWERVAEATTGRR